MTESEVDSAGRLKGVTMVKPIVYGNVSRYFGKKREEDGHTHQWTVYLKPCMNEDMSSYVKRVHFKLHESYANSNRVITKPPYEVTETGWGEFEVVIKIYFHDPNERPVTIYHLLKLFHTDADVMQGRKSLITEYYDELVFQEPSTLMQQFLSIQKPVALGTYKHETDFEDKKDKTLKVILGAKAKIKQEIVEMSERLKQSKEAVQALRAELAKVEDHNEQIMDT